MKIIKGKQRFKLLRSQKILLQKQKQETINLIQAKQRELNQILAVIMVDQGVPEKEINQWQLVADGQGIEKIKPKKPPKDKDKEGE